MEWLLVLTFYFSDIEVRKSDIPPGQARYSHILQGFNFRISQLKFFIRINIREMISHVFSYISTVFMTCTTHIMFPRTIENVASIQSKIVIFIVFHGVCIQTEKKSSNISQPWVQCLAEHFSLINRFTRYIKDAFLQNQNGNC